jgi:hypothetical protein
MPHNYSSHRKSSQHTTQTPHQPSNWRHSRKPKPEFQERTRTNLTKLIELDAPLYTHSHLVLMYGPFQTEMAPEEGQGVASWIRDCVRKHGLPSLVRFDYHRRAQIFRRDQFQPWLEPLLDQAC